MQLSPRYDGPVILTIDASVEDPGLATTRQRRRMEATLGEFTEDQWATASRCEGWTVRDVVAHLITVNQFWESSVRAALDGNPSRVLARFDPAAHPAMLVASLGPMSPAETLEQFAASNEGFLDVVADLTGDDWALIGESPIGHVPLTLVADHALWDSYIHDRDINLPLGLPVAAEADELEACLRYAAALGRAINVALPSPFEGELAVSATDPATQFVIEAGETVTVSTGLGDGIPCLEGAATDLIDALSLRAPLPADTPQEWNQMMQGLVNAFATE